MPDFVLIGAMKCGTSSLHEQLDRRSGICMSRPKEPCFFSDDAVYARGLDWYASCFGHAGPAQLCGESSTHYTKLPTFPETVARMKRHLPETRLVYMMRDPLARIVSQYIHEWTQREVTGSIDEAVEQQERYVAYSSYARQLEPFVAAYGRESILLVAFEHLVANPHSELTRICRFLGDASPEPIEWREEVARQNVSSERMRKSPRRDRVLAAGPVRAAKDLVPKALRDRIKSLWRLRQRPTLSERVEGLARQQIDNDLARLGEWLGRSLSCAGWADEVLTGPLEWRDGASRDARA